MKSILFILIFCTVLWQNLAAQYKSYKISIKGDTINTVDINGLRQGPWVVHVDPLRGEPGYEEEGYFVDDKKEGQWRKYNLSGDFIAFENYTHGDKDGKSQYFNQMGTLIREESWHAYNPDKPYDTIPVYGEGNNNIISYRIVKAKPYSVKDGEWVYYDSRTGRIARTENYERGRMVNRQGMNAMVSDEPMEKIKPKEVIEYEQKNSKKKKVKVREGRTSY